MRTDGVHCRESAGTVTGLAVLRVVRVTKGAVFSGITIDQFLCASLFPRHLLVCSGHVNVGYTRFGTLEVMRDAADAEWDC